MQGVLNVENITLAAKKGILELLDKAKLEKGDIFVVGCSSSEITGATIGQGSDLDAAKAVLDGIYPVLKERGIYLASQCCEHLNRAIIIEKQAAKEHGLTIVNAVPQKKAGGSFATNVWAALECPCAVEAVQADAGMDIGGTLIGMHLKAVAVPVRTSVDKIGKANVIYARTRPKFVGGERAVYDPEIM